MGTAITELLGGEEVLGTSIASNLDLARAIRVGLPIRAAIELANQLGPTLGRQGVFGFPFTGSDLSTGSVPSGRLTAAESDVVVRTATALARAIDVLGQKDKAVHWLSTPNPALGGEIPITLLDTSAGEQEVQSLLDRIEYGVYS